MEDAVTTGALTTNDEIAGPFERDGAVLLRGLLDPEWVETLRGAADRILEHSNDPTERLGGATETQSRASDGIWRWCEPFARFLFGSPLGTAAAIAMRSRRVVLYEDLFLYTDPTVEGARWHRDSPHWPLAGKQLASVWLSLEPVTKDTGALRFVAGSHHDADELVAGEKMQSDAGPDRSEMRFIAFDTEPGDAVVFHPRLIHAALGAADDRPRRTFTIRFAGDDIRWRPRTSYYHAWMREAALEPGEPLDHPWFPEIRRDVDPMAKLALSCR